LSPADRDQALVASNWNGGTTKEE